MPEKILLVDDDAETVRLISVVLERQGYHVISSYEGPTCIQLSISEKPDLILLDVMMPGMDGYQVTRVLRENADTTNIPILMFSAKNQVEDRVAGYESGIDDYLTKPIHPAELVARVKSLIARSKTLGTTFGEKGHTIGVLAIKGGVGTSTFVLGLAMNFNQLCNRGVIAAEIRPGHGTWINALKLDPTYNLCKLLRMSPGVITTTTVNDQFQKSANGILILAASNIVHDVKLIAATEQIKAVTKLLPLLSSLVILDLGAGDLLNLDEIVSVCDELFLMVPPTPLSIAKTGQFISELESMGMSKNKPVKIIVSNYDPEQSQLSLKHIEEKLDRKVDFTIPDAKEIAILAEAQNRVITSIQPDSRLTKKYNEIAQYIVNSINPSQG